MDDQSSIRTDYWDKEMASGSAGGGQSGGSSVDVDGEVRSERKGDGDAGLRETKNVMADAVKAVQWGKLESLKRMVEANQVRVNDSDDQNCSLLHWASINNRVEIVKFLLQKHADVNRPGGTLQETPLQWAARQGHLDIVILLYDAGGDLSIRSTEGLDALMLACHCQKFALAMYLLSRGCSPNVQDNRGLTPLARVCRHHSYDLRMIRLLLTLGAAKSIDAKHTQTGNTALHWAILQSRSPGTAKSIFALLDAGASLTVKNKKGLTPLALAEEMKTGVDYILKSYINRKQVWMQGFIHPFIIAAGVFMLLSALGWFLGLIAITGMYYVAMSRMRYGGMMRRHGGKHSMSLFPFGSASALIFFISASYLNCLVQMGSEHVLKLIVAVVLIGSTIFTFFKSATMDPGYMERITVTDDISCEPAKADFIAKLSRRLALGSSLKVCATCIVEMPPRSKHDPMSDRCVQIFDHYCPFINNCVGQNNHKYFMGFLVSVILAILNFLGVASEHMYVTCGGGSTFEVLWCAFNEHHSQVSVILATIGVLIPVSCLLTWQTWLISNSITTYEYMRLYHTYGRATWCSTNPAELRKRFNNCKEFWQRGSVIKYNPMEEV
eukprot:CAMPEP_0197530054 /NCGR_PEP_ID=MMETSP1318-20131121/30452_1 /TAXON_ID=552666 /ORGANISM="Partenskyella glossopodia, Strain RCC365" /LENGTH=609 /DNA_ID=CAMNT_0043085723 /DNA_START=98 /DNA_END=1927 /DNA_ORIENTATION=+